MGSRRGNMRGAFENILKKFSPNLTPAKRFGKGQAASSIGLKIRKAEYFLCF